MRRVIAAVLAAGWIVAGCGTFAVERFARNDEIRGPWRAEPLSVDPATISAAENACQDARSGIGQGMAPLDRLVAVDARGSDRLTLVFSGAGAAFMECELLMDARGALSMAGGSVQGRAGPVLLLEQDDLTIVSAGGMVGAGDGSSAVYGRFGHAVAAARVVFPTGSVVQASVGNGWFMAWWPTDTMGFVVEGLDSTGHKIAEAQQ